MSVSPLQGPSPKPPKENAWIGPIICAGRALHRDPGPVLNPVLPPESVLEGSRFHLLGVRFLSKAFSAFTPLSGM